MSPLLRRPRPLPPTDTRIPAVIPWIQRTETPRHRPQAMRRGGGVCVVVPSWRMFRPRGLGSTLYWRNSGSVPVGEAGLSCRKRPLCLGIIRLYLSFGYARALGEKVGQSKILGTNALYRTSNLGKDGIRVHWIRLQSNSSKLYSRRGTCSLTVASQNMGYKNVHCSSPSTCTFTSPSSTNPSHG